jgi:hypothetical protein
MKTSLNSHWKSSASNYNPRRSSKHRETINIFQERQRVPSSGQRKSSKRQTLIKSKISHKGKLPPNDPIVKFCYQMKEDPLVYSSVLYKYHSNTASKISSRMNKITKNLKMSLKENSKKKSKEIYNRSKSYLKAKKIKSVKFTNKKMNVNQNTLTGQFETFRKIQKESPKKTLHVAELNMLKRSERKSLNKPTKMTKKISRSLKQRVTPTKKQTLKFNSMMTNNSHIKFKAKPSRTVTSSTKSPPHDSFVNHIENYVQTCQQGFNKRMQRLSSNAQKEYAMKLQKPHMFLSKHKRKTKQISTKDPLSKFSNDTIEINRVPANSRSLNKQYMLQQNELIETNRVSPNHKKSSNKTHRDLNEKLLKELQHSQMQNLQFAEIISELQHQIKLLKKEKKNTFSFKNLSDRSQSRSPTANQNF